MGHFMRAEGRAKLQMELASSGALFVACQNDHPSCAKLLLKHVVNPDGKFVASDHVVVGGTALHLAAHYGHCAPARVLLESGSSVDARDAQSGTPLHVAVQKGHVLMVRLLCSFGADMQAVDVSGCVP